MGISANSLFARLLRYFRTRILIYSYKLRFCVRKCLAIITQIEFTEVPICLNQNFTMSLTGWRNWHQSSIVSVAKRVLNVPLRVSIGMNLVMEPICAVAVENRYLSPKPNLMPVVVGQAFISPQIRLWLKRFTTLATECIAPKWFAATAVVIWGMYLRMVRHQRDCVTVLTLRQSIWRKNKQTYGSVLIVNLFFLPGVFIRGCEVFPFFRCRLVDSCSCCSACYFAVQQRFFFQFMSNFV